MSCLLHRTGLYDTLDTSLSDPGSFKEAMNNANDDDKASMPKVSDSQRIPRPIEEARDLSKSYAEDDTLSNYEEESDDDISSTFFHGVPEKIRDPHMVIFRLLLREVINGKPGGGSLRRMQFPSQVDTSILPKILRREFRRSSSSLGELDVRRQVAFSALRALNLKLSRADRMQRQSFGGKSLDLVQKQFKDQAAKFVTPFSSSEFTFDHLRPGTYLIAHPQMTGYFRRTVIVLLDRSDDKEGNGGTYGLIVNRSSNQTLAEVLRIIPEKLRNSPVVDTCNVRDGGPVHMSVQMIHALHDSSSAVHEIGGTALDSDDQTMGSNLNTDRTILYQGDIFEASEAVKSGVIDVDDVCFYVGASCWAVGQLENEIESGYWIPCRGPPETALTGKCETVSSSTKEVPISEDLWLSMISAVGPDEAMLGHWHYYSEDDFENNSLTNDDGDDDEDSVDDSVPCDIFG